MREEKKIAASKSGIQNVNKVSFLLSANFLLDVFCTSLNHLSTKSEPKEGKNDCKLKLAFLLAVVVRFFAAVKHSDALLRTTSSFCFIFFPNIFFLQ